MQFRYLSALGLATTCLIGGCASQHNVTTGTDDVCGTMDALIADYPNGFANFRERGDNFLLGTVYQAKVELIDGHCQVWSWGQGDAAYLCSVTNPSLDIAKTRHERALASVRSCLGQDWQEEGDWRQREGETDGYASRFRSPHSDAVVSVQTTMQVGGPGKHFTNFLYIGGEARSESLGQ